MGEDFLTIIGETIDRLLTLDIAGRGVIGKLYEAARAVHKSPLCLLAAKSLAERVKPNDIVFIATGMIIYPFQHLGIGENDGPVGGAALARALRIALGAKTLFITDRVSLIWFPGQQTAANALWSRQRPCLRLTYLSAP